MLISRTYEYRTDFSRLTYNSQQTVTIEDNLHPAIIHAETQLLGARVRYLVDAEVYETRAFPDLEYAKEEFVALRRLLASAITGVRSVCKPAPESGLEPIAYERFADFLLEARIIRDYCQMVLDELASPTIATV